MNLSDLVKRSSPPLPWAEGDNIPWSEPGFSQRMLRVHLSQAHDWASRRFETIDRQVSWIHDTLLAGQPARILDLCCGPGLYAIRLAHLGHTVHGIDYSPASIDYAISTARQENLSCTFIHQDVREAQFPSAIDLVMLIYGELNVFRPADAILLLDRSYQALKPGGVLLLEPHPYKVIHRLGHQPASWYSSSGGLNSDQPHIVLQENFWEAASRVAMIRYFVIDAASGQVSRYAQTMQAYKDAEYRSLLTDRGFMDVELLPGSLGGRKPSNFITVIARKGSQD